MGNCLVRAPREPTEVVQRQPRQKPSRKVLASRPVAIPIAAETVPRERTPTPQVSRFSFDVDPVPQNSPVVPAAQEKPRRKTNSQFIHGGVYMPMTEKFKRDSESSPGTSGTVAEEWTQSAPNVKLETDVDTFETTQTFP